MNFILSKMALLYGPPMTRSHALLLAPLFGVALCFSSCTTPHLTVPAVATVRSLPWQKGDTGLYFDNSNKDFLISEGVPRSWFANTKRGWYLNSQQLIQAENIRSAERNHGVWQK